MSTMMEAKKMVRQLNYTFTLAETLPNELIREILLTLPVKHLLRMKCVNKYWRSFISDPEFAKSHFDLAAAPAHHLIIKFYENPEAKCIDTDASLEDDSANVVINVPNPSPSPYRKIGETIEIVGSCRGLLLITSKPLKSDLVEFLIWNPSTGFHKRFSKLSFWRVCLRGFGYDSSTDDYVAVAAIFPQFPRVTQFHCFSLRNNSWSCTLSSVPYINQGHEHGSFLNGALHWVVNNSDTTDVRRVMCKQRKIILAFDVKERSLSEISLPTSLTAPSSHHLRVMGGCLCLSKATPSTNVLAEMWIMKEYKVHSSWSKLFVLTASVDPLDRVFLPICFTKNGEILGHNSRETLVKLDDNGELLEHRKFPQRRSLLYGRLQYCGMYTESLLTLPDNIEN